MGNLCGKGENTVTMASSAEDNKKAVDHQNDHDDSKHKKVKVDKPQSNNTADLLGLAKEKEIIVVEQKTIKQDAKKPELDKKTNILEKFEFSLPFNQVNILAFS
jgi:hypothetical protein